MGAGGSDGAVLWDGGTGLTAVGVGFWVGVATSCFCPLFFFDAGWVCSFSSSDTVRFSAFFCCLGCIGGMFSFSSSSSKVSLY